MEGRRLGIKRSNKAKLSGLIPEAEAPTAGPAVQQLPIEEIRPNRLQPRKTFDPVKLQELVSSIRSNGIIQPVLAREVDGGYELIAGERRYRAACMAGLKSVPAILRTIEKESDALELTLIENIQREDLNPIEEAEAFRLLMAEHGYTQELLSRKLGRARASVANVLRLLKLPEEVQDALSDGVISTGHGKALLGAGTPDEIRELLVVVLERELNVRQTEELVKRFLAGPPPPPPDPARSRFEALNERLGSNLGTRVTVVERKGGGGRIQVEFRDDDDLDRIVETMEKMF